MVQEVTTTSWGKRIMNAFAGMIIGLIMVLCSFYLIFWNEGHGLHTAQSLEQAEKVLVRVPVSPVSPENNLKVVYFSGQAVTEDVLKDSLLGVSEQAISLKRSVEMYQWKEHQETRTEKQMGGSEQEVKTYTYEQVWSSDLIDSSQFKEQAGHQNPTMMMVQSETQYAKNVTVGNFELPNDMVRSMSGYTEVDLSKIDLTPLKERTKKPVQNAGNMLYVGDNAQTPVIGDLRITESVMMPQRVSVIAQQSGNTLQPYMAPAGITVSLLEMGQVSSEEMIHNAQSQNTIFTWLLRLGALALMVIGLSLLMQPIVVLADVVPFFGSLVGIGTGFVAFVVGFSLWVIAIAIAWFVVRPVAAVALLVLLAGAVYAMIKRRQRKLAEKRDSQ